LAFGATSLSKFAIADSPGHQPVNCIIKSSDDAREKVRGTHELFEKLNQTSGFVDYISSITGCPRGIRQILTERFAEYDAKVSAASFPLDAETCAALVVQMDRLGAWVESYQQARVHQVGSSYIPDVCVTAHLKVDYSDPCDHSSTDALKVMSDAAAQQAASIEVAAEQVPAPGPPTTPPKPIGVRGPFHPAHPPTEAELAEQARKGLNSYKAGQADGIDMARFMVDAETRASVKTLSAEDYEKIRRLWATKEEAYRELVKATPGDKEVKTRRLMKAINKDFTSNYCRDQARISSFLGNDRCGNCVAETILEIAALRATDLMPDPPSRLTVQAFGDHAQAII
jgi:hypothetical protein